MREANKKAKKKVPTHLVIAILEAKNQKEAKRIIASIGKAKGGGKTKHSLSSNSSAEPEEPVLNSSDKTGHSSEDSDDDEGFLSSLNMYVNSQWLSAYAM